MERSRAIDPAPQIDELCALAGHPCGHVLAPAFRPVISREQSADAAGQRDARPPGACRQRDRRAREREAAPGEFDRLDPRRRRLRLGLARPGIGVRRDQFADARRRRGFAIPVDRHEQRSGLLAARSGAPGRFLRHARSRRARNPSGRRTRASAGCTSTNGSGVCWPRRGLNPVARHGVPLVAHAAGVEHERIGVRRVVAQRRELPAR